MLVALIGIGITLGAIALGIAVAIQLIKWLGPTFWRVLAVLVGIVVILIAIGAL